MKRQTAKIGRKSKKFRINISFDFLSRHFHTMLEIAVYLFHIFCKIVEFCNLHSDDGVQLRLANVIPFVYTTRMYYVSKLNKNNTDRDTIQR